MKIPKIREKGEHVLILQRRLNELGAEPKLTEDGVFGKLTKAAVSAFQKSKGLRGSGVIGPKTMTFLGLVTDEELGKGGGQTISSGRDADEGTREWYRRMFYLCKIDPGFRKAVERDAQLILSSKERYERVGNHLRLPWWLIGAIHLLEGSCDFDRVLHNGQRIIGTGLKTSIVPKGRGPFATWEDAAVDALTGRFTKIDKDPEIGNLLFYVERYNGTGYISGAGMTETSPYLWARTNVNDGYGKYVYDGKFDPSQSANRQSGFCAILKVFEEGGVKIKYGEFDKSPVKQKPATDITRDLIADELCAAVQADVDAKLRETGGKNRGRRIDEFNLRAKSYLGAPYCASGLWVAIDDVCKKYGLSNPVPPTASSQNFRRPSFVPSRYLKSNGGERGDFGVLQSRNRPGFGHLTLLRAPQMGKEFLTLEYNTSPRGSRDGDGAYALKRNTVDGSVLNNYKNFVCFTDIPQWVVDHNS